jgi:DnaJ family protein A protein 2
VIAGFDPSFFLGRKRGRRRGEDLFHTIDVTLEDLYCGKTVQLAQVHEAMPFLISLTRLQVRRVVCTVCSGKGSNPTALAPAICRVCAGARITVSIQQLGPGLVQHIQGPCRCVRR